MERKYNTNNLIHKSKKIVNPQPKQPEPKAANDGKMFLRMDEDMRISILDALKTWCECSNKANKVAIELKCKPYTIPELNELSKNPSRFDKTMGNEQAANYSGENPYMFEYIKNEVLKKTRVMWPADERAKFKPIDESLLKYAVFDENGDLHPDENAINEDCKIYISGEDLQAYNDMLTIQQCAKRLFCGQAWRCGGTLRAFGLIFQPDIIGASVEHEEFSLRPDVNLRIFRELRDAKKQYEML